MIRFEFAIKTVTESNTGGHWAPKAKRAQVQRNAVALHLRASRTRMQPPCVVRFTRLAPGALDGDNLQSAMKHLRDSIADYLGVNDNDPRVDWQYAQEKRTRSRKTAASPPYSVRIEIEAA